MSHVVALSGGKDSTAMALRLVETEPRNYKFICTPTGNELPEMTAHWNKLETILGQTLIRVPVKDTLQSLIRHFRALPNNRMRWCTRILKIEPCIAYLEGSDAVLYVGLRADEPPDLREGGIYDDVEQRFPLREWGWGLNDVLHFLESRNIVIPKRTDCAWCYHQRLRDWWELWKSYPELYQQGIDMEAWVSNERGRSCTFRNASRDHWPVSLAELRDWFEAGKIPPGAQANYDLFDNNDICRACTL